MPNCQNVKMSNCQNAKLSKCQIVQLKLSKCQQCQQCQQCQKVKISKSPNVNNVKLSTIWNCQQCEIVKHAIATSFFYIYVIATSFFYIYIDIYIEIYIDIYIDIYFDIDITFINWRSVQSFYWTLFFNEPELDFFILTLSVFLQMVFTWVCLSMKSIAWAKVGLVLVVINSVLYAKGMLRMRCKQENSSSLRLRRLQSLASLLQEYHHDKRLL